jgi:hypothetical protein
VIVLGTSAAAVAAVLVGGLYYALMPAPQGARGPERSAGSTAAVELVRSAVVAALVAGLLLAADLDGPLSGGLLGLALWLLPVVLLAGSVFHEGAGAASAALHAGDWLLKLVVMGVILGISL